MLNVLFTSVGRRVELVRAFRRAYEALALHGRLVAADIDPLAPALQSVDRHYLVPRLSSPDFIPTLINICQREQIRAVFPLIDRDVPVLAQHREAIEATGAKLAVIPFEAVAVAEDKWRTVEFFRTLELPAPRSWLPGQRDFSLNEFPLFIKPRRGSAAMDTFKVASPRELAFFSEYVRDPIIQEYLPGPEITSDVICDVHGHILGVVSRQRIEVRWGEVAKGVTVYDPMIAEACCKIAQALPAIGPITVQCMMKEGVPHFTEINARMGGGLPLGVAAGADAPLWLLATLAGLPIDIPPLGTYQTGLYLTRFDDSFFLTEEEYARIASSRL
jgi:carbamoyl-phosphate synthase large subunit